MTQDAPLDQKALEAAKAVEDDMRWLAADRHRDIQPLVRERLIEGADMIERFRDALSRRVPASGGEALRERKMHVLELLRTKPASLEAVNSVAQWIWDADRALAASPIVAAPEGWRLVPEYPDDTMMQAGLYQSSHDAEWADVFQSYVDMVRVAPTAPTIPEGKAEPVIWLQFNATDGFTGLRRWTRDKAQAERWMAEDDAHKYRFEAYSARIDLPVRP